MLEEPKQDDPLYVPTIAEWDAMSPVERNIKEDSIIAALEQKSSLMGESTRHFYGRASVAEVLGRYFKNSGKQVFVASDLHTLYPGERAFYPDILVVFDVDDRHRSSWNAYKENRGLDFALEILSKKTHRRDKVEKMNIYARIGIPEYFFFDPIELTVKGFSLKNKQYVEIKPGKYGVLSKALGLCLKTDNDKIRFNHPEGLEVPFADELMARLNEKISKKDEIIRNFSLILEEEKERTEEEKQRVEEEKQKNERLLKLLEKHGIDPNVGA